MHLVRTIVWVALLFGLLLFSWANWEPGISVRIWTNLVVDTRLPALVIVAFLAGLVPMWLIHRGAMWRLQRRLQSAEDARAHPAPAAVHRPGDARAAASADGLQPVRPDRPGSPDAGRP
ncbi:hypothetical protein EYB45_07955 [Erythrobacteraceae bacterium CFH 75059]|uniref:LapA family protein n=1 Tax=Qipengyuania thermophila TaxID=2509361 RepID=UPI00101F969E|nr:LapA family protein [Qipengyuania thermophila]TCD05398.1 hypothetical protein EYB45_07955 [Erythrobacteraceae bacterium CFH 75059]